MLILFTPKEKDKRKSQKDIKEIIIIIMKKGKFLVRKIPKLLLQNIREILNTIKRGKSNIQTSFQRKILDLKAENTMKK